MITTKQVSKLLGVSPRRVLFIATARKIGVHLTDRMMVFKPSDVEKLRPGKVGRPKKGGK
jgi:hypothetical protein